MRPHMHMSMHINMHMDIHIQLKGQQRRIMKLPQNQPQNGGQLEATKKFQANKKLPISVAKVFLSCRI